MDNDISHAVEERLIAIEARLDALDGGTDGEREEPSEEVPDETPVASSYRGRRRSVSDVVSESEGSE